MIQETLVPKPNPHERKEPHEQYVRRGDSPFYFSYAAECWHCGLFFALSWPPGVEHVAPESAVIVECPGCNTDFGVLANNLLGSWDNSGLRAGHVRRIESIVQEEGPAG